MAVFYLSLPTNSYRPRFTSLAAPAYVSRKLTRKTYIPNDDLDKQSHSKEYIDDNITDGEDPPMYFERVSLIREKLAEVGIHKTDREAKLHTLQRLSTEDGVDTTCYSTTNA